MGQMVTFKRIGTKLVVEELGLSVDRSHRAAPPAPSTLASDRGIEQFTDGKAKYTLVSCDGIMSQRFRKEFPNLFH